MEITKMVHNKSFVSKESNNGKVGQLIELVDWQQALFR